MHITITPLAAHNALFNYIWLIHDNASAIVVDPTCAAPVLDYLSQHNLRLISILLTHRHPDHIAGTPELQAKLGGLPIYGPSSIAAVTHPLQDGDAFSIALMPSLNVQVLYTPGHTDDHLCYHINQQHLFCGDVLFSAGCGRIFPLLGGNLPDAYQSIQKLTTLPDDTLIYCAHEYTLSNLNFALDLLPNDAELLAAKADALQCQAEQRPTLPSTLGREKRINLFLRCHEAALHTALSAHLGHALNHPFEVFTALRTLRNQY